MTAHCANISAYRYHPDDIRPDLRARMIGVAVGMKARHRRQETRQYGRFQMTRFRMVGAKQAEQ